jgi:hypothetical protein
MRAASEHSTLLNSSSSSSSAATVTAATATSVSPTSTLTHNSESRYLFQNASSSPPLPYDAQPLPSWEVDFNSVNSSPLPHTNRRRADRNTSVPNMQQKSTILVSDRPLSGSSSTSQSSFATSRPRSGISASLSGSSLVHSPSRSSSTSTVSLTLSAPPRYATARASKNQLPVRASHMHRPIPKQTRQQLQPLTSGVSQSAAAEKQETMSQMSEMSSSSSASLAPQSMFSLVKGMVRKRRAPGDKLTGTSGFSTILPELVDEVDPSGEAVKMFLEDWLHKYMEEESKFDSKLVFCEVKLQELLHITKNLPRPHPFRTWVCCDLLMKLVHAFAHKRTQTAMANIVQVLFAAIYTTDPSDMGLIPYSLRARQVKEQLEHVRTEHTEVCASLSDAQTRWQNVLSKWHPAIKRALSHWMLPVKTIAFVRWRHWARKRRMLTLEEDDQNDMPQLQRLNSAAVDHEIQTDEKEHTDLLASFAVKKIRTKKGNFAERLLNVRRRYKIKHDAALCFIAWRDYTVRRRIVSMTAERKSVVSQNEQLRTAARRARRVKYGFKSRLDSINVELRDLMSQEQELRLQLSQHEQVMHQLTKRQQQAKTLLKAYCDLIGTVAASSMDAVRRLISIGFQDVSVLHKYENHPKLAEIVSSLPLAVTGSSEAKNDVLANNRVVAWLMYQMQQTLLRKCVSDSSESSGDIFITSLVSRSLPSLSLSESCASGYSLPVLMTKWLTPSPRPISVRDADLERLIQLVEAADSNDDAAAELMSLHAKMDEKRSDVNVTRREAESIAEAAARNKLIHDPEQNTQQIQPIVGAPDLHMQDAVSMVEHHQKQLANWLQHHSSGGRHAAAVAIPSIERSALATSTYTPTYLDDDNSVASSSALQTRHSAQSHNASESENNSDRGAYLAATSWLASSFPAMPYEYDDLVNEAEELSYLVKESYHHADSFKDVKDLQTVTSALHSLTSKVAAQREDAAESNWKWASTCEQLHRQTCKYMLERINLPHTDEDAWEERQDHRSLRYTRINAALRELISKHMKKGNKSRRNTTAAHTGGSESATSKRNTAIGNDADNDDSKGAAAAAAAAAATTTAAGDRQKLAQASTSGGSSMNNDNDDYDDDDDDLVNDNTVRASSVDVELEVCEMAIGRFYVELRQVFRAACSDANVNAASPSISRVPSADPTALNSDSASIAGASAADLGAAPSSSALSAFQFWRLIKSAQVLDANCTNGVIDNVYTAKMKAKRKVLRTVMQQQVSDSADVGVTFDDLLEILARIAVFKYPNEPRVSRRIVTLFQDHLLRQQSGKDGDDRTSPFREQLSSPQIERVIERHSDFLRSVFRAYAKNDPQSGALAMELEQFSQFVSDAGLVARNHLSYRGVKEVFDRVQLDDELIGGADMYGGDSQMVYYEFVEGVSALACFVFKSPYIPLETKINDFVTRVLQGPRVSLKMLKNV